MLNQKLGRILCEQRQVTLPKVKQLTFLGGRDAGGTPRVWWCSWRYGKSRLHSKRDSSTQSKGTHWMEPALWLKLGLSLCSDIEVIRSVSLFLEPCCAWLRGFLQWCWLLWGQMTSVKLLSRRHAKVRWAASKSLWRIWRGGPNPGAPKAVRHVGNGNCTVYGPLFSRMTQKSAKALRKARVRSLTINHWKLHTWLNLMGGIPA